MIIWVTIALILWLIFVVMSAKSLSVFETLNCGGLMFLLVVLLACAFVLNNVVSLVWSLF